MFFSCAPPCFISLKLEQRFLHKKNRASQSALCTNCIFRSWCINPHNSHGSVILHSIYNMLQLGNPQHIFSDIKEERELWKDTGQNQTSVAAQTGHCHLDCALCFETHQRKSEFCLKNHNMTSIPPLPSLPGPCSSLEERKMWILRSIIPKKYTHYEQEWEIHIPDPSVKPSCLDPGLFVWLCWDARGSRGIGRFTVGGVSEAVGRSGCLLCKEPPPESLSETKKSLCDSLVEASQSLYGPL